MTAATSFTPEFKDRLVIEILTGETDINKASLEYGIETTEIRQWKAEFLERTPLLLESSRQSPVKINDRLTELELRVEKLSDEFELVEQIITRIKILDEINQEKFALE